jgi:hypothetical protein
MNREKANEILKVYEEKPMILPNGNRIIFARETIKDVEQIEKLMDEELIEEWKGLVYINHVYGCVSVGELERINLIELEMDSREECLKRKEELRLWFEEAIKEQEIIEKEEIEIFNCEERLQIGL